MTSLPVGYRWANEDEDMDSPGAIVVPLTEDSNGVPYTNDEADIAVPIRERHCAVCGHRENGDPAYASSCCTNDNLIEE